jgi:MFS family permease
MIQLRQYPTTFFVTMLASVSFFYALQLVLPLLPRYALLVGANEAGWGFAVTVTAATAGSLRLMGGPIADQLGRKRVMIIGAIAMTLGSVLFALIPTYGGVLLGRMAQGFGLGTFTTAYKALIIDMAPPGRRGVAIGIGNLTFSIALLTAPPIGEALQVNFGYPVLFAVSAGAAAVAVLVAVLLRVDTHAPPRTTRKVMQRFGTILSLKPTRAGVLAMFAVSVPFVAMFTFLSLLAEQRALAGIGLVFSAYALSELFGQPLGGAAGRRFGRPVMVVVGLLVSAGGLLTFLLSQSTLALIGGAVLTAAGLSVTRVNLDTIVADNAPDDLRGTATGLQYASFDMWIGIGSWLYGIVAVSTSYEVLYTLMAAVTVLAAGAIAALLPAALRAPTISGAAD